MGEMIAGILDKVADITLFLNPSESSYQRFGQNKAPKYISWSSENRSQLIRVPAAVGEYRRAELRSPDPTANTYLAFTLLIYASLHGISEHLSLPPAADLNLFKADANTLSHFKKLPDNLQSATRSGITKQFCKKLPAKSSH